jgi:hypothetical protein
MSDTPRTPDTLVYRVTLPEDAAAGGDHRQPGLVFFDTDPEHGSGWWIYTGHDYIDLGPFQCQAAAEAAASAAAYLDNGGKT